MPDAPRVLLVSGSAHPDGPVSAVLEHAIAVAGEAEASLRVHDLAVLPCRWWRPITSSRRRCPRW
ncbi:MAG: hypothetical protein H6712_07015 [Myxococcales bacterium]|nr:hypothetical protein [Myxococcales bacterium]MCB9713584.1 hypothetical protein [Myxococcales bacterium]